MNWDAVGAISELFAAIGVIASLIYVGTQVKDNAKASRIESKLRMTDKLIDFGDLLIENANLHKIMLAGRKDINSLSKEELIQFSNLCQKAVWHFSAAYFMYKNNAISDEDFHELHFTANYWLQSQGFRQWWEKGGNLGFTGEYKDFVEQQFALTNTGENDTQLSEK